MKGYVGITDDDWYRYLAEHPEITEINFWKPSDLREFKRIDVGEPFLFKTHAPHNSVVGGAFFSGYAHLRVSEAWELLDEGNGAATLGQMRERISRYRKEAMADDDDPIIACIFLHDPFFLPADAPADPPPDFDIRYIVQGKTYDLAKDARYADYFHRVGAGGGRVLFDIDESKPWHRSGPVYGEPKPRPVRRGQDSFKAVVLHAYGARCAVTGSAIRPALQAAHIRPLPAGGEHRTDNGILLRSDIHTMFDRGYLGLDTEHRLLVSPRLRRDFDDTDWFYDRDGCRLSVPERRPDRPHREFVEWHRDNVFRS
ncbi:HNH endonuclease [Halostreptopolyspora alba]|uniref:HNH endonuclease n=1 Tax=Halostreptopolyspora alba TaxID=2487137 RepID=A0A3N0EGC8_9ACTN|nr:HNH endonuclease [Nocardiopsaceae bacterium YIM 96095]